MEGLENALKAAMRQDVLISVLHTLAKEYAAKAISQDRFAERVLEEIVLFCKQPEPEPEQ